MRAADLAKTFAAARLPTEESTEAELRACFTADDVQRLLSRDSFSWRAWTTCCLCRYVGQSLVQAALCARISRTALYGWFETVPGLQDHLDGYDIDAQTRLAARLHQFAESDEDSLTTRWMAERRCEQYRPPAKQSEITVKGPEGVNIVLSRGDGTIIEPPTPNDDA